VTFAVGSVFQTRAVQRRVCFGMSTRNAFEKRRLEMKLKSGDGIEKRGRESGLQMLPEMMEQ